MIDCGIKIFNWNVRGLNESARRETVLQLLTATRPALACLQETKLSNISQQLAKEIIGPAHFVHKPADGTRGGILIAWDTDQVAASNTVQKDYSLSVTITLKLTNVSFILTTVYGPTEDRYKLDFLEELRSIKPPAGSPWVCLGDFNLIYEAKDKSNLNLNRRLMGQFRAALDTCELLEISLHNRKFTWSNERDNLTLVHLDRVFCNEEWDMLFSSLCLQALSSSM